MGYLLIKNFNIIKMAIHIKEVRIWS